MTCEIFAENAVQINTDITPEDYCNGFARCGRGGLDVNSANLNYVFRDAFTRILALEGGTTVVNNDATGSDIPATPPITPPNAPTNPKDGDIVITHYDNGMCVAEYNFTTGIWETNCHLSDDDNVGEASTAGTDIYGNTYGSGDPIVTLDNGDVISLTPTNEVGQNLEVGNDLTSVPNLPANKSIRLLTCGGMVNAIQTTNGVVPILQSRSIARSGQSAPTSIDILGAGAFNITYGNEAVATLLSDPCQNVLYDVTFILRMNLDSVNMPDDNANVRFRFEIDFGGGSYTVIYAQLGQSAAGNKNTPYSSNPTNNFAFWTTPILVAAGSVPVTVRAVGAVVITGSMLSHINAHNAATTEESGLIANPQSFIRAIGRTTR